MEWLRNIIKNNPVTALVFPAGLSGFDFFGNLLKSLADGHIDGNEINALTMSASGLETILLVLILCALREKKKK